MYKVAVVILNWNGEEFLKKFLPGIINYSVNDDYKVFVADNGSVDGSVEYVRTMLDSRFIICLDKNYGFANGYVKVLEKIDAEYFVLLNSDVEVTEGWIKPVIDLMDADEQVAACMPKIKSFYNRDYFEYAGAAGGFLDRYGFPFCRGRILTKIEEDLGQYDTVIPVFWATGACLFVRAKHYFKVGGLDGDFFAHMEEIDLCWRFNNAGLKVMVYPGVHVFHVGGGTLPNNNPRKIFLNFRNSLFMLFKNLSDKQFKRKFIFRIILDSIASLKFLLSFQFSFFWSVCKAHIQFWSNIKVLKQKRRTVKLIQEKDVTLPLGRNFILLDFFIRKRKKFDQLDF